VPFSLLFSIFDQMDLTTHLVEVTTEQYDCKSFLLFQTKKKKCSQTSLENYPLALLLLSLAVLPLSALLVLPKQRV
jgi:hypothetical protein